MNIQIHLSVAYTLKQIIEEELSIKINTAAFLFGSIKPDVCPYIVKAQHEIKHSKEFIENEIKSFYKETITNKKCNWEFSERLGIVTHYLCDFFCHVHSDLFKGSTFQHFLYEIKHLKYFLKSFKTIIKKSVKSSFIYQDLSKVDDYLTKQYNRYIVKAPSAARDLIYSLKICSAICLSVIALHVDDQNKSVSNNAIFAFDSL